MHNSDCTKLDVFFVNKTNLIDLSSFKQSFVIKLFSSRELPFVGGHRSNMNLLKIAKLGSIK